MAMADDYDAHVLILGASFTGLELVRRLRRSRRGRALEVLVVDRQAQHPYIPLSHELLTRRMPTGVGDGTILDTAAYVRGFANTRFEAGTIVGFDVDEHAVTLADGRRFSGRFVVVALGSEVRPPSRLPGGERLRGYKFATELDARTRELEGLLDPRADAEGEPAIVVVGGGITGVEIAGELGHLRAVRPQGWRAPKVTLVHGGERLLPRLTARAGAKAAAALQRQGVEVLLGARLLELGESVARIRTADGDVHERACALGIWGGGLQPPPVLDAMGLPRTDAGWLRVGPTLQCFPETTDEPEIFAGGDIARIYGGDGEWPTMQRAIEGIFAADTLCRNILTLAARASDYPEGVPPLSPHRLWEDFPHGVSVGASSLVVYGPLVLATSRINTWFRRFLMRQYMRRYAPAE